MPKDKPDIPCILDTDGSFVSPETITPAKIFVSLSAINRFGGKGDPWFQRRWSVLHHSLLVAGMVLGVTEDVGCIRAALLHDSFECFTGDIPTPFKPDEVRATENAFLNARWPLLPFPYVKPFDRAAGRLEARFLWPGLTKTTLDDTFGDYRLSEEDFTLVWALWRSDPCKLAQVADDLLKSVHQERVFNRLLKGNYA